MYAIVDELEADYRRARCREVGKVGRAGECIILHL